jgi:hypothetical protein
MQHGKMGIIFDHTRDTCNFFLDDSAIRRAEGMIYLHGFGKEQTRDNAPGQDDNEYNRHKHYRGAECGTIQFFIQPPEQRIENAGDHGRPENGKEEWSQKIQKQKGYEDQRREKQYVLDSGGFHISLYLCLTNREVTYSSLYLICLTFSTRSFACFKKNSCLKFQK